MVAVKTDTKSRYQTVSGPEGFYTVPQLLPGEYELTAESAGFKKYRAIGNSSWPATSASRQNVELSVGDTTESITVSRMRRP